MGKPDVIVLTKLRTYIKAKTKTGRKDKREHLPKRIQESALEITPDAIFEEEKPWFKFWRNPKRMIFHIKGELKPLKIDFEKKVVDLGYLTLDDILKAVKAEVVKQIAQLKPIKFEFFLILLVMNIITLAIVAMMAMRIGVF